MNLTIKLLSLISVAVITGCSEVERDIVARVANKTLSKETLGHQVDLFRYLYQNKLGAVNPSYADIFESNLTNSMIAAFKSNAAIEVLSREAGLTPPDENTRKALELRYTKSFGRKGESFGALINRVAAAGYGKDFDLRFEADARAEFYFDQKLRDRCVLSDAQATAKLKQIEKFNEAMNATNENVVARAKYVHELATKPGANFAELADKYSEDPEKEPGGKVTDQSATDFEEIDGAWDVVSSMREGEISPVFNVDLGCFIFKLDGNIERDDNGKLLSADFSRIWIRKALFMEVPTIGQLKKLYQKEMKKELMTEAISNALERLEHAHSS